MIGYRILTSPAQGSTNYFSLTAFVTSVVDAVDVDANFRVRMSPVSQGQDKQTSIGIYTAAHYVLNDQVTSRL